MYALKYKRFIFMNMQRKSALKFRVNFMFLTKKREARHHADSMRLDLFLS